MVIWKEREDEIADFQAVSDPTTIEALLNCGLLKYFRVTMHEGLHPSSGVHY